MQTASSKAGVNALEILEHVSDAVAVIDSGWVVTYVNGPAENLTGKPKDQVIGRGLLEVLPALAGSAAFAQLEQAAASGSEARFEYLHEPSRQWFDVRALAAGGLLTIFVRDKTDLKCYQRLFESSAEGILIVNDQGHYVDVNESYASILKTTRDQLIGKHFSEFIPPELLESASSAFQSLRRGGAIPLDFPLRAVDGTTVELSWTATSNYLPGLYFCCCRDISARKRAEQERILMLERTRQAVEHSQWIQSELKRSNEELRRANRDLETFAYSASHDLQEPLRNIAIFGQLLERRLGSSAALDPQTSEFLEGIIKGTKRMESLVQDLLAYSRATRAAEGSVPLINAQDVLTHVIQNLKERIEESGAVITSSGLPQLSIHAIHLEQLLQNLLSNAIKYRDRKSTEPPRVEIWATQEEGRHVISVSDNGIGMDERYWPQIFGLFKRLHSRSEYSGSGVGLAICQRIVEQYGGRIWVERSEPGKGSVFSFSIPER